MSEGTTKPIDVAAVRATLEWAAKVQHGRAWENWENDARCALADLARACERLLAESDGIAVSITQSLAVAAQVATARIAAAEAERDKLLTQIRVLETKYGLLGADRNKLLAFKNYVHHRLDAAGVSPDPDSPHKAEGCRIGGRLDELIGERDRLRKRVAELEGSLDVAADAIIATPRPAPPGYVVYVFTRLQDGAEEGARCFERLEDALAYINAPKWGGDANTYHLFELGREIPLGRRTVEEPQPAKTATVYAVANPERAEGGAA